MDTKSYLGDVKDIVLINDSEAINESLQTIWDHDFDGIEVVFRRFDMYSCQSPLLQSLHAISFVLQFPLLLVVLLSLLYTFIIVFFRSKVTPQAFVASTASCCST